ncbi:MAG: homoserine dehydrogenase, partial [Deltaproteobacteria bacterium]|nr:homoserine dehydrogenase [Deltaproteobacteria bacterium]
MKTINVGLIGFGTVGSGLAEVLLSQQGRLVQRSGLTVRLAKVADIMISELPLQFTGTVLTDDAAELINDPDIDIVVELIGGIQPAKTFVMDAIGAGKHVVTANKALLSQEG